MYTLDAIIEIASDGTFSVYCKEDIFSGAGDTIEGAKKDMLSQMEFYKKTAIEQGFKYPSFLDGPFEVNYSVDSVSLMRYYVKKGFFSLAGMEKVTGINQKQLWAYLNGTKPRKTQMKRIETGFLALKNDLNMLYANG
ncbi:MAG: type II toxin-antitoxin system HicB family antitoxin [Bacteroidales bacterium]|nr:type II toxin-antitoxin system HicB family antitoxin [Bacteroidales bacterium]